MNKVDVIVPVLNEAKNLPELIKRIGKSLNHTKFKYGIIIIDDYSTDDTSAVIQKLSKIYPITLISKEGLIGKGYSIIQGSRKSDAKYVVMIDGDLQYAPEYIPHMLKKAEDEGCGVVIGNRAVHHESKIRQFISRIGHLIYGRLILGLNSDTQSGLKLIKREIINQLTEKDVKPWAFDLPLLYTAKELGEKIDSIDIDFEERKSGVSKINFIKTTWEILATSFNLRWSNRKAYHFTSEEPGSMLGSGVIYKKKKFITHTTLHHSKSALITFTLLQKLTIIGLIALLTGGLLLNSQATQVTFIAILSLIYFLDVFFGLYLVLKSLKNPPEIKFEVSRLNRIKDVYLPVYTILCPLYKEDHILPQFVKNIQKLDWPKEKLDVILLLESDDLDTRKRAQEMNLPKYFRTLVVPESYPKTKPKACNYGLAHAKGEYVVIYDAEDAPEPQQLKKAFLGFLNVKPDVFCLQAKLNYYNPNQNLLTKLFTAEYSLWFDIVLPGLQAIETTIPLGGTSNHFRTNDLKKLEGWDPFNVAEDADLGARLFRQGFKTAIIDSITLEEANSDIKNWIRQRSRWIKGYLQTYFVQMRNPLKFVREQKVHYFIFQLVSGLRVSFMLINPFLWAMTLAYFLLFEFVGPQIEALYPTQVFYIAAISAVFGNFLYVYYYMIGAAKRGEWGIIKYIFLVPFYWLLTSIGAFLAFYQLIFKPHYWEKTVHGLNKVLEKEVKEVKKLEIGFIKNLGFPATENIKKFVTSDFFSAAFLIAASMVGNILNFLYNAYLGRKLDLEDFGLIGLVGSFVYITSIPLAGVARSVTYRSGFLFGKFKTPIKEYWQRTRSSLIKLSIILAFAWLLATPFLTTIFKADTTLPFLIFVPVWVIGFAGAVDSGFLSGNLLFTFAGATIAVEALTKLLVSVLLVEAGLPGLVYIATPLSMFIAFTLTYFYIKNLKGDTGHKVVEESLYKFPQKFFISSIANKISTIAFLSLDLVMAKLFLSPEDAGRYAILSLAGKMVYLIGSLFAGFVTPVASVKEGEGSSSETYFYKLLGITTLSSLLAFLAFGIFGYITTPILFGSKVYSIISFLPLYTLAILLQTLASTIVNYHQVKERHSFSYLSFVFSMLQILAIVVFHQGIEDIVRSMVIGGGVYFISIVFLHFNYDKVYTFVSNLRDFLGIFSPTQPVTVQNPSGLPRILIFNWRDTKHVWSGGAEVYIHEIAKRLVAKEYKVTIFCGNDGKSPRNEKVDGIQIIRRGGFYTVYIWAFLYYTLRLKNYFDVIIDCENGTPFFTPLYAKKKIFLLIHHVHQELFRIKLVPPLSWIGKYLEKQVMPIVYNNTEVITVSPSSKADILEHKITQKEPHVIYNGVDLSVYKPGKKSLNPLILYLGRLTPQKSLTVLIRSAKEIIEKVPSIEIVIAGDGQDRAKLIKLTKKLGLEQKIRFLGKVSQEDKVKLYQKAWVFVNPSLIEGWGITTIEANACGTPVVASNVAGLRDSVHNPHSGLLVPYGNIDEFSKNILNLIKNRKTRVAMSKESVEWAKIYSWEKSATDILNLF